MVGSCTLFSTLKTLLASLGSQDQSPDRVSWPLVVGLEGLEVHSPVMRRLK